MLALGIALVVCGAALLAAEAHVPTGALGLLGGTALAVGAALAISAAGGGLALVLAGVGAAALAATAWAALIAHAALGVRGRRPASGREALSGRMGVVRSWSARGGGQVLLDGALWQARPSALEDGCEQLAAGDEVVVERVRGLTLTVRRAEEWEVTR